MSLWRQRRAHGKQAAQSQIASIVKNMTAATRVEDAACTVLSPICWAAGASDSDAMHCDFLLQYEQLYQQAPVVIAASEMLWENTQGDASTAAAAATASAEPAAQIVAAIQIQRLYRQWHSHWGKPKTKVYTLEELTDPLIWRNLEVNPAEREMLLPDGRFRELFSTDKDHFQELPKWRRERLRKTIGFFDKLGNVQSTQPEPKIREMS